MRGSDASLTKELLVWAVVGGLAMYLTRWAASEHVAAVLLSGGGNGSVMPLVKMLLLISCRLVLVLGFPAYAAIRLIQRLGSQAKDE